MPTLLLVSAARNSLSGEAVGRTVLCILYINAIGGLLAVVGLLLERLLPATAARRWIWCAIIPLSIVLPGVYRARHNWVVTDVAAHASVPQLAHDAAIASLTPLNRDWWARSGAYDGAINWIWWKISIVLLLWGLANALRVIALVASSRHRVGVGENPVVDGVSIVITDRLGPATAGLLRSSVLVPRWVLTLPAFQRRYVLRHEEEHRRAHDPDLLLFYSLPLLLLPWSVAMWWQLRRLALAVELDCDNRVVRALGDAPAYGELLLSVAEAASRGPRLQPAFLGGLGSLERRITALLSPSPLRRPHKFLLSVLIAGLLLIVVWMPHPILGPNCSSNHAAVSVASTSN